MPKKTKKRTEVKNLPKPKQEVTAKTQKKIKGGEDRVPAANVTYVIRDRNIAN